MSYIFFKRSLCVFFRKTQGSILPMAAFGILLLLIAAGAAVDFSREQYLRVKLSNAIDSATLAAAKSTQNQFTCIFPIQTQNDCIALHINEVGKQYFNANFNTSGYKTQIKPIFTYDPSTGSIIGTVKVSMSTTLMQVAGINSIPVDATSVVQASVFYLGSDLNHLNPMVQADPSTGMYTQPYSYTSTDSNGNTKTTSGNAIGFSAGDGTTPVQQAVIDGYGLTVTGQIRVGITTLPCNTSTESALRYDKTVHAMEYCDGTAWRTIVVQSLEGE